MPTLGQKLLEQQNARAEAKKKLEEEKSASERRRVERERKTLQKILTDALEDLRDAVAENRVFKGNAIRNHYSMPVRYRSARVFSGEYYFWQQGHPHYDIFEAAAKTARLDGVEYVFTYEHDGVGIESWHVVSFKPLDEYLKGTKS